VKYLSAFILRSLFTNLTLAALAMATLVCYAGPAFAQTGAQTTAPTTSTTGTLRGQVTDPSGAVVANATVGVLVSGGQTHSATTSRTGTYEIGNLPAGKYIVTANAQGFAVFVQSDVDVAAGQTAQFNIRLDINVEQQKVNVEADGPQLDVNPANNASAIVLKDKDLEALPDDPDELQSDLEALAGPSAGPNGGQIYIDGFTGGQLPPKSSIREIRINSNPFSAEYDKLGYGRIEVFTKPGTDKYHGQFSVVGNDSAFNSRNPFLGDAPQSPYDSVIYMGNFGGPIGKKASFFFDVQRRNIDEIVIVNVPDLSLSESVPNPRTRTNLSPRFDYQVSTNNTLTARYQYYREAEVNDGVGGTVLPVAGYDSNSTEQTLQISDTQILGTKAVNETRFQYLRDSSGQNPFSTAVGINVVGSFTGGGSSGGSQTDHQDHYELQNYTSLSLGKHFVKFGGRLRTIHEVNESSAGFNGTYTFLGIADYNIPNPTPSQYSISATQSGNIPSVPVTMVDVGLYLQDDWKVRPNFTLSGGLRFETQNEIHDHADWAPRLGFAWGLGGGGKSSPKTVLRGGFGLFYDRFGEDLVLNADRQNGVIQQQYIVASPSYPTPPPVDTLPATSQAIYQINSGLHASYTMQTAFSLERQVTKIANVTVSYLNARGVHQFVSLNVNAPTPGTPGSLGSPPDPSAGPIYQYVSEGVFRQNQLIANFNIRAGAKLSLFGYYSLNYANSDASGASSFPVNQYDLSGDYGRASFDTRHRVFFGGTVGLPRGFRLSPFMIFNSGSPYNVTVGPDLNNDTIFNDRPSFAVNAPGTCASPTQKCFYNQTPSASDALIPINYLTGPNHFTLNLRLAKTFGFGPEIKGAAKSGDGSGGGPGGGPRGGGGPGGGGGFGRGGGPGGGGASSGHRYSLTFSVNARNVLNKVNAANPIGTLSSPNFGQSIASAGGPFSSAAANRKIELQGMFSF
jgi:Carboxypeptidase regulatory-like domain